MFSIANYIPVHYPKVYIYILHLLTVSTGTLPRGKWGEVPCPRTQRYWARSGIELATFRLLARFPNHSGTWLPSVFTSKLALSFPVPTKPFIFVTPLTWPRKLFTESLTSVSISHSFYLTAQVWNHISAVKQGYDLWLGGLYEKPDDSWFGVIETTASQFSIMKTFWKCEKAEVKNTSEN